MNKNLSKFLQMLMTIAMTSLSFSTPVFAEPLRYAVYQIQPKDTVSDILWRLQIIPVYGKRGMLKKTVELNQDKLFSNGDLVFPMGILILPITQEELTARLELVERNPAQAETVLSSLQVNTSSVVETNSVVVAPPTVAAPPSTPVVPEASAPTPGPTPVAPVVAATPAPLRDEYIPFSEVQIGVQGDYAVLNGQDRTNGTNGKILSKINSALQVNWKQNWSDGFATYIMADTKSMSFEPEAHGTNLYNNTLRAFHFGMGVETKVSSSAFSLGLGFGDEIFYRGYLGGGTGIELNTVSLMRARAGYKQVWLSRKPFSLLTDLGVTSVSSGSYDNYSIQSGWVYDAGLYLNQDFVNKNFMCGAVYSDRKQNTSLIIFSERDLGIKCVLGWRL